jgi:hypothetical protein
LEQVFPFLGVRFLSVNDHFDSSDHKGSSAGIEVGFKTLIHDLYSRDLSVKTKTGKLAKMQKGEHVGGTAPFGYLKSKTIKNAWLIDEDAAVTIRRIYGLAADGMNIGEIARTLNGEGIPTPLTHRRNNDRLEGVAINTVDDVPYWRSANVSRILRDEQYTGKLISGKTSKGRFGSRKTAFNPKSSWLIVPDAHAPIIPQAVFDKVQVILGPYNQRTLKRTNTNIFAKKLFCGHCRHALRRYGGLKPKYVCRSSMELGGNCLPCVIYEADVTETVLAAVRTEIDLAAIAKKQADKYNRLLLGEREKMSERIRKLSADVLRLKNGRESLFEDYTGGKITKEQFLSKKAEITAAIEAAEASIAQLSDEIDRQEQDTRQADKYAMLSPYAKAVQLTPEIMALVDGVYVYDAARIEIKFTFADARS